MTVRLAINGFGRTGRSLLRRPSSSTPKSRWSQSMISARLRRLDDFSPVTRCMVVTVIPLSSKATS